MHWFLQGVSHLGQMKLVNRNQILSNWVFSILNQKIHWIQLIRWQNIVILKKRLLWVLNPQTTDHQSGLLTIIPNEFDKKIEKTRLNWIVKFHMTVLNKRYKWCQTLFILQIYNNPLECDSRMCWMKEAEKEGWISYIAHYDAPPECANTDKGWYYIDLNCTSNENEV